MSLAELIELCESKQNTLDDYKKIRTIVEAEYDKMGEEEQYVLGESLEFLDMTIDMLEGQGVYGDV